jgi:hypothetical protein
MSIMRGGKRLSLRICGANDRHLSCAKKSWEFVVKPGARAVIVTEASMPILKKLKTMLDDAKIPYEVILRFT